MDGAPMKERTEVYERLFDLVTLYISDIMVHGILGRALARCGVSADSLALASVMPVVEQSRIGIGMFCEPARLPSLMLDLAGFCDAAMLGYVDRSSGDRARERRARLVGDWRAAVELRSASVAHQRAEEDAVRVLWVAPYALPGSILVVADRHNRGVRPGFRVQATRPTGNRAPPAYRPPSR